MPQLVIACPSTGKRIQTGFIVPIEFDPDDYQGNSIKCPECDEMHTWNGIDAVFEELCKT